MSDDWVRQDISIRRQRAAERQQAQMKAQRAEAGAPDVFKRLQERIRRDVEEYHNAGFFPSLSCGVTAGQKENFRVSQTAYPAVTLEVELDLVTIHYRLSRRRDDASEREMGEQKSLRIYADLNGSVQIYKNGTPYADESEVSEFLLKPVLDYIDG